MLEQESHQNVFSKIVIRIRMSFNY